MSQDPETPVTAPGHHVGIPGLVGEADVAPFGMNGNSGQDDAADVGVTHWSETSHGACITKTQRQKHSHTSGTFTALAHAQTELRFGGRLN